jgi:UDP-N-acetylmuramoylalanine--D-glutamate ligase
MRYTFFMTAKTTKNRASGLPQPLHLGDVCVLGLGLTGKALLRCLLARRSLFDRLTVYAGAASADDMAFARQLPAEVTVVFAAEKVDGPYDLCVVSPGIAPQTPLFRSALAASAELIGEPELAWRLSPER